MTNLTVLITGASSGIGFGVARRLARENVTLVLASEHAERRERAARRLRAAVPACRVVAIELDLARLGSVRSLPERLRAASVGRIDRLVCNAGVQYVRKRRETTDGLEATFQVNHLGHFLLVNTLLPEFARGASVVIVSSTTHDPDRFTGMVPPAFAPPAEVATRRPGADESALHFGQQAYTTSKLYNILFGYELARRLPQLGRDDVRVHVYDPGAIPGTGLVRDWPLSLRLLVLVLSPLLALIPGFSTLARSTRFLACLVLEPASAGGAYYSIDREARSSSASHDRALQQLAWSGSCALVGLPATSDHATALA